MTLSDATDQDGHSAAERFSVEAVNSQKIRQPLYAPRRKIFPKRASGTFRRFKWLVMLLTLGIYYLTPFLRWDRGPFAPDQAVMVDLANRRFYFFFIEIWPQEFYYVAGLLIMAGVGLFLITSTVGRAWCGYTCPQTVWVDLFLVVERAIEGDRNARIKLDGAPWSLNKAAKRVSKHVIWLVIGVVTGGAWILYFADAPTLIRSFARFEAPSVAYMTVGILAATTYVFGGLMREQVCTYMCPWPRIQAAMLDEYSLTVTYNDWRGEPRTRHAKKAIAEGRPVGDCVDCNACVVVCPMGIDIRDGQQLECITCALCIDACDGVMDKLGRERGLISYATLNDYNANMVLSGASATTPIEPARVRNPATGKLVDAIRHTTWRSIIRPRTLVYFMVWAGIGVAMLVALSMRSTLEVSVLHDRNPQYVLLSDGSIRNGYKVKISNMRPEPRAVTLSVEGLPGAALTSADAAAQPVSSLTYQLQPDAVLETRIFVRAAPGGLASNNADFTLKVETADGAAVVATDAKFETPKETRR
ncbi:cytochrome c oxidase accessory protein FixG [Kaistia soli DSM 19436]|uniref:Cytochrome c oxidase accessory protein FixG n=1 Tax=Kaistia soli DSM 19436 TaxID=1122133 RepID=A0A1M5E619_9HYPH|nr:cytochrome c oxidase accessory protein CcoG [Kaistia soli]SHF74689.1 cytochrome c oxidase accessory protein FixG [Kaistia soli DSM 19436]